MSYNYETDLPDGYDFETAMQIVDDPDLLVKWHERAERASQLNKLGHRAIGYRLASIGHRSDGKLAGIGAMMHEVFTSPELTNTSTERYTLHSIRGMAIGAEVVGNFNELDTHTLHVLSQTSRIALQEQAPQLVGIINMALEGSQIAIPDKFKQKILVGAGLMQVFHRSVLCNLE